MQHAHRNFLAKKKELILHWTSPLENAFHQDTEEREIKKRIDEDILRKVGKRSPLRPSSGRGSRGARISTSPCTCTARWSPSLHTHEHERRQSDPPSAARTKPAVAKQQEAAAAGPGRDSPSVSRQIRHCSWFLAPAPASRSISDGGGISGDDASFSSITTQKKGTPFKAPRPSDDAHAPARSGFDRIESSRAGGEEVGGDEREFGGGGLAAKRGLLG
jgi:hypothetical protein